MDGRRTGQFVISLAVIAIGFGMTASGSDFAPPLPKTAAPAPPVTPAQIPARQEPEAPVAPDAGSLNGLDYRPELPAEPDLTAVLLRLGGGLIFVTAVCGVCVWAARRWIKKHGLPGLKTGNQLQLLESTRLAGHCTVHLLEIGGQRVLAGTDRTGLHSLVPLPEPFTNVLDDQFETQIAVVDSEAAPKPTAEDQPARPDAGPRIVRSRRVTGTPEHTIAAG